MPAQTQLRFVVLHHTGMGEAHFDLMVEGPGMEKLLTWRVANPPEQWKSAMGGNIGAARIADHRKHYLTYDGPISGGRGEVKRVMEGRALCVFESEQHIEIVLHAPGGIRICLPVR